MEQTAEHERWRKRRPSTASVSDVKRKRPRGLKRLHRIAKGIARKHAGRHLRVCGPEKIQTLRGSLLGRQVALVLCGEAHEDAIDLTRKWCILEPEEGWVDADAAQGQGEALATKDCSTLKEAKSWAEQFIGEEEEKEDEELLGSTLVYHASGDAATKGTARLYSPSQPQWHRSPRLGPRSSPRLRPRSPRLKAVSSPCLAPKPAPDPSAGQVYAFEWADLDRQASAFNRRRLNGEEISRQEQDELIALRKHARLLEGLELFDDWLLRQAIRINGDEDTSGPEATCQHPCRRLEIVLEAYVPASEVELHRDSKRGPAPAAHSCLRAMELDSDEDSDVQRDPDDGTGTFAEYLRRRVATELPKTCPRPRHIDPRELGDADDKELRAAYQALLSSPLPADVEERELEKLRGVAPALPSKDERPQPLPSWEAFFGAASELLYYSPNVKADYMPFLLACVAPAEKPEVGGPDALRHFFRALYFGTVPEAIGRLRLDGVSRSMASIRSLAYQVGGELLRRQGDENMVVPVRAAPVDCYLKAKGSDPPRTWVSALADRLRRAGATELVNAAEAWYFDAVEHLLEDPKAADQDGDYFLAWLRECHREVYDDIDRSEPRELRCRKFARSLKRKAKRYNLREIRIPKLAEAFAELAEYNPEAGTSSRRQRVLGKILVDIFQLRLVDLAAALVIADCAAAAPAGSEVVVVLYAGGNHAKAVEEFWRSQGFTSEGLANQGLVGRDDWEDDDPRGLVLPSYLHDMDRLFPIHN